MRRILSAMAVAACLVTVVRAEEMITLDFERFTSTKGGFRIEFPGEAEESTEKIEGGLVMHSHIVGVRQGLAYGVIWMDLPAGTDVDDPWEFLENVLAGAAGDDGEVLGKLRFLQGAEEYPSIAAIIDKPANPPRYRTHIVMANNRVYQVMVVGSAQDVTNDDAEHFFDTFRVTKK